MSRRGINETVLTFPCANKFRCVRLKNRLYETSWTAWIYTHNNCRLPRQYQLLFAAVGNIPSCIGCKSKLEWKKSHSLTGFFVIRFFPNLNTKFMKPAQIFRQKNVENSICSPLKTASRRGKSKKLWVAWWCFGSKRVCNFKVTYKKIAVQAKE